MKNFFIFALSEIGVNAAYGDNDNLDRGTAKDSVGADGLLLARGAGAKCLVEPDVEGEGQFWMCAPDQRKQPCQLGCEEGFNQIGEDLYVECLCKKKSCQYIRKYKTWEPNMEFWLTDGWITNAGFSCQEETTTVTTTTTTTTTTTEPTTTTSTTTTSTTTTTTPAITTLSPGTTLEPPTTLEPTTTTTTTTSTTTTSTSTTTTTTTTTTTSGALEPYQCQHLPIVDDNTSWVCKKDVNSCQLACNSDDGGRELTIERGDGDDEFELPKIDCRCDNVADADSCLYFIDNKKDSMYTDAEIVDMYAGICDPSTTVAPTTAPTLINKCGELPVVEVGFWTCHDTVCVLECAEGQIAHINLALQCLCLTEEDHCTFIKVQPSWLTDARRFDFALGFETRDGFKCKEIAPTQPPTTTTTPEITSCENLPMPGLPWGSWVCSPSQTYCSFVCPENFTRNKQFNIKCKCGSKKCFWVKQNPIALDVTSFTLGWHAIENLQCLSQHDDHQLTTTRAPVTDNQYNKCILPETDVGQWVCHPQADYAVCNLGCPAGEYKNRQIKVACFCDADDNCDYKVYSKLTKSYENIESEYWLEGMNFRCIKRPEMDVNTGNGRITANKDDDGFEDAGSVDLSSLGLKLG